MIPFAAPLLPATFLHRDNRFRATLLLEGERIAAHVPNSGRLNELFVPGARCFVSPATTHGRKTSHDLRLVEIDGALVSIDARLPNALLADALTRQALPHLISYTRWRGEVTLGKSQLDFLLSDHQGRRLWVETKSVTLVEDGVALFPDAPTLRGQKHLAELAAAVGNGAEAMVIFVVQRADADRFATHPSADPGFRAALVAAHRAGVDVRVYRCHVDMAGIEIAAELAVVL